MRILTRISSYHGLVTHQISGELDIGYVMFLTDREHCLIDMLFVLQQHPNIIAFVGPGTSYYVLSLSSLLSAFR